MGVVIRLQRAGTRNRPFFRVVVMDSRKQRDGAFLEKLGYYDPVPNPELSHNLGGHPPLTGRDRGAFRGHGQSAGAEDLVRFIRQI